MPTATKSRTRQTKARTKPQATAPNRYYSLEQDGTEANIVIYGDVTSYPWAESDVSAYNLSKQIEGLDVETINVGINSYGGEVAEGLAIYNALKRHKAKVRTRCDGFACSVASVIFAAGDERVMADSSLLMIHNAWTFAQGDAKELRKQADDLEKINEASIKAYMAIVSVPEEELRALMDEETWISPEEALDMGLATSIESTQSDNPSQSVRGKVMQMLLRNPYQLDEEPGPRLPPRNPDDPEDPEENPDEEPDTTDTTDDTTDDSETGDTSTDSQDDETDGDTTDTTDDQTDDTTDNPDENPDDENKDEEQTNQMLQFLNAIAQM